MTRQYIGARYVPRFIGTYSPTTIYDALDVVDDGMGTSYIARKTVPAGTALNNTEYWFVYGASSGAIISLQNRMTQAESDITALQDNISPLPPLYSALETYAANDYVVYNGKVYQAIAPSTGVVPTNTSYWVNKGTIEDQFTAVYTAMATKAALSAFDPSNVNLDPVDFTTYGSLTCRCTQVGRILIIDISIVNNIGVAVPANTLLHNIAIPTTLASNTFFNITSRSGGTPAVYELLYTASTKKLSLYSEIPAGHISSGQIILPAANWI